VVCTADVTLGEHVVIMPQVVLTHDVVVGDHVTIGAGVTLAGGVSVGESAYLGAGSHVRQHVTIGASALVGMASTVLGDVPPDQTWAGTPARPLGSGVRTNGEHRRPRRDQAEAS
jgi:acyl-[acyl carrier protein]--UDP-N-acetylglucosamine O-acyltransferase